MDEQLHPVEYLCITPEHLVMGESVPDGQGTLTVNARQWAYCSAGLMNAPHDWQATGGVTLASFHHPELRHRLRTS